jgi:hypothetical protein
VSSNPLQVRFPSLGVVRRFGLRPEGRQAEFGAPWSYNVRLEDGLTSRLRGGSFTGISAAARPSSIVYRDRTLTFSGRAITASRVGSADTAFSADLSDMLRPALFQFAEAGEQGPVVVALVPHKDQFLVGFSATETWVQQGDPLNGPRRRISDQVGIIGPDAWCVAHDTVYFMSSRGLYSMGADGSGLKAISEEAIPVELSGWTDATCKLTYQHSDRGVYIHRTATPYWFYDIARDSFWPFDTAVTASHILCGPFHVGQDNYFGRIQHLHGSVAHGSTDVTWRIITGDSAEEAANNGKLAIEAEVAGTDYEQYVKSSGTWIAGRAHMAYPRTRGIFAVLWLSSTGDWAWEAAALGVTRSGKWR